MLVLSRREGDKIDFPGLGISIEVMKLTRSRAALGFIAPRNIPIVRHELAVDRGDASAYADAISLIDAQFATEIDVDLDSVTKKLKAAKKGVLAGNADLALNALSDAFAELDALRSKIGDAAMEQSFDSLGGQQRSHWESAANSMAASSMAASSMAASSTAAKNVAEGVAEANAPYACSNNGRRRDCISGGRSRVRCMNPGQGVSIESLADTIRCFGFDADHDGESLQLLHELVRSQDDDTVLLVSTQSDPIAGLALVPDPGRHPDLPITVAGDLAAESHDRVTASRSLSPTSVD
ncbi:MAG: carbon storage regulator [Planctomycetales bacterium]|nr:carbon storage regulator [Planctomycetales bacterium]